MPVIAPYWGDVDTRVEGAIWYGKRNSDQSQLNQVKAQVKSFFPSHQSFEPNVLFVVTWDGAPSYHQSNLVRFKIQYYNGLINEWMDGWMDGWVGDHMYFL